MQCRRRALPLAAAASGLARTQPLTPGPIGQPGRRHPGRFIWFDLDSDDPPEARAFDAAVFGWRFRPALAAAADYHLIENASGRVGGLFRQGLPPGGQVLVAPRSMPGRGRHAVFRDPLGPCSTCSRRPASPRRTTQ